MVGPEGAKSISHCPSSLTRTSCPLQLATSETVNSPAEINIPIARPKLDLPGVQRQITHLKDAMFVQLHNILTSTRYAMAWHPVAKFQLEWLAQQGILPYSKAKAYTCPLLEEG